MQIHFSPSDRRFSLALALALSVHLALLALHIAPPAAARAPSGGPLRVTVIGPAKSRPALVAATARPEPIKPRPDKHVAAVKKLLLAAAPNAAIAPVRVPAAAAEAEPERSWSRAEKEEIDEFLNPQAARPKQLSGRELASRAMAMARTLPVMDQDPVELQEQAQQNANLAKVEPFSLEMYFDALYRKLNRMAPMVKHEPSEKGRHAAAVRVTLNPDGTVKSFRVLWAADQQAEIAYVNNLFERAAPFSPFPRDILNVTHSLILQICIMPGSGNGDAMFSPMASGSSCRG